MPALVGTATTIRSNTAALPLVLLSSSLGRGLGCVLLPALPRAVRGHLRFDLRIGVADRVPALVELAGEVVDSDRSVILDQVTNGVAVRMAVLYLLAGADAFTDAEAGS